MLGGKARWNGLSEIDNEQWTIINLMNYQLSIINYHG
jgi:hypothetical protein